MRKIIYIDRDMVVIRSDPFGSGNKIRAHGAGERDCDFHMDGTRNGLDPLLEIPHILARACGIVEGKDEGIEFMPSRDAVETQSEVLAMLA